MAGRRDCGSHHGRSKSQNGGHYGRSKSLGGSHYGRSKSLGGSHYGQSKSLGDGSARLPAVPVITVAVEKLFPIFNFFFSIKVHLWPFSYTWFKMDGCATVG
ncbi:unnamed protein product, partial [Cuscuta epithymum]